MTTTEIIARLETLKENYRTIKDLINQKNDEIVALSITMQGTYDEYFDLYRQLNPLDIPDNFEPTTINT